MFIHFHHSIVPNSGELKRMKNIDKYMSLVSNQKSIEIEFYPFEKKEYVKTEGQFILSDAVTQKYYVPRFKKYKIIDYLVMSFFFAYVLLKFKPTMIIAEMRMLPRFVPLFKRLSPKSKVFFDIHGAAAAEAEYQGVESSKVNQIRDHEKRSLMAVDYIICQSDEMKEYMATEYGIQKDRVCVFRCGVDTEIFNVNNEERKIIRKDLGIKDEDCVFVYAGGMHPWQRVSESVDIFEMYHQKYPSSKFLILTGDNEGINRILTSKNIANNDNCYIIRSLPYNKVPDYLNAADIAFLLRHNHVMNAVASPTKLAEYLACGLPVITSEVASKWVNSDGLKFFVQEEDAYTPDRIYEKVKNFMKEDISRFAQETLSLSVDYKSLVKFYKENIY